mgnify:CR=1 FL=1
MERSLNRILSLCVLTLLLFSACYAAKRPDWTKKEPLSNEYYYGVSTVSKSLSGYKDIARENALKNISLQISVQIKAELQTSETEISGINSSQFISSIQSSTGAILDDVELYQVYETGKEYSACWRLSKIKYRMMREARKALALSQALDLLGKYDEPGTEISLGIGMLLNGLDLLESYVDMDLSTEYRGERIQLFNEFLSRLRSIPASLQPVIDPNELELVVKRTARTTCEVKLKGKDPLTCRHFPLSAVFSQGEGELAFDGFSDETGSMKLFIDKISSFEPLQTVTVSVNKDYFLPGIKSDAVRSIWQDLAFKEAMLTIHALKPKIFLSYVTDSATDDEAVKKLCGRILELDLGLADTPKDAHYYLEIKVSTREGAYIQELGAWSAFANVRMNLTDPATNNVVYSASYDNIKGTGKTVPLALQRARQSAANYLVNEVLYSNVAKLIYR